MATKCSKHISRLLLGVQSIHRHQHMTPSIQAYNCLSGSTQLANQLTQPTNNSPFSRQLSSTSLYRSQSLISENYEVRSPFPDILLPNMSLAEWSFNRMAENSDKLSMVDTDTGARYTWGDMANNIRRIASGLTRRGYQKGDVVCIFKTNSPEFCMMFLAVSAVGGIVSTANPLYKSGELRTHLEDSKAKAVFMRAADGETVKEATQGIPHVKDVISFGDCENCTNFTELLKDSGDAFPDRVTINPKEDVVVIPYSSGTTGLPKGVMLTHHNIVTNIHQYGAVLPFKDTDTNLCVLPMYHIYAMVLVMLSSIRDNYTLYTMSSFDLVKFLTHLQNEKITTVHTVPPMILLMSKHPIVEQFDLSHLRQVLCAAAPLGADLSRDFVARFPNVSLIQVTECIAYTRFNYPLYINMCAVYGMTETSPVCLIDAPPTTLGSIGKPVVNTIAKVVDLSTGANLGPGEEGELYIKGPQVMKGYLNRQQATSDIIKDGWLYTGDLATFNKDGLFSITGRLKEIIKYKGFQVPPAELENILLTHPDIQDTAVIGVPDEQAGELPRAYVVLKPDRSPSQEDIMAYVNAKVTPHKKLRGGVRFIKEIPKSTVGKILRQHLPL